MTFSPLVSYTIPTHGKYSPRYGVDIVRLIEHHWASTSGGIERMNDPNANVSCNYLILTDGTLVGQVPEEYRAFTSGSPAADNPSITVEIQNSSTQVVDGSNDNSESWPVSDAAFATLCALLADLYTRYGWADMGPTRLRGHREFASTACPGGYLWARRELARETATKLLNGSTSASVIEMEEDEEMNPKLIARIDGANVNEWMLVDPAIGRDLNKGETRTETVKVYDMPETFATVVVRPGALVTTDRRLAYGWGRTYCRAYGNAPQTLTRTDYMPVQAAAEHYALELRKQPAK